MAERHTINSVFIDNALNSKTGHPHKFTVT